MVRHVAELRSESHHLGLPPAIIAEAERAAQAIGERLLAGGAGGVLLSRVTETGIELLASEQGTALADLSILADAAADFELVSPPGCGSKLFCRFADPSQPLPRGLHAVGVTVAQPGEDKCGDGWHALAYGDILSILLVDGLGHGAGAAAAAETAVGQFREIGHVAPAEMLQSLHRGLRGTQGAVVAVANIDVARGTLTFSGVGNIGARIFGPNRSHACISTPGVVGFRMERVRQEAHPWSAKDTLVMHTDGLRALSNSTTLIGRNPTLVAGALYAMLRGGHDDCGVVVARDAVSAL